MEKEYITAKIFFEAVLPNLPIILDYYVAIDDKFKNKNFTLQLRVEEKDYQLVVNYTVANGVWSCNVGKYNEKPDIEFCFNSVYNFNTYISGIDTPTPKIKGLLKIGLLKDVLVLLNKFAFIMQSVVPHENDNDRACQARMLLNVLPMAVSVISAENLTEIVINFSSIANIIIKSKVIGSDCDVRDIILKYAPQNSTELKEPQIYEFIYSNIDQVVDALLNAEFDNGIVEHNSYLAVELMKFLINSVNYYARLKFRN